MTGSEPVALAHDYLLVLRGAERTFAGIADCWPQAPIYTTLYDPKAVAGRFAGRDVRTSRLQRLGVRQRGFRRLAPLFPSAVEHLDVAGHRLIVSSSSAFMHGLRPAPGATHVCYCHTPFRYAWHERATALAELPRPLRPIADRAFERIRRWDVEASGRVTHYVANGRITQQRIRDCYGRDSVIVHPPVEVGRFAAAEPEDFLLIVCELVAHKRVDVALRAARSAGLPVRVVGTGPAHAALAATHPEATFLGRADDAELAGLYARCLALVVPNVEEFGITAVEAQAAGRPVVGQRAGGAGETVLDGTTGILLAGSGEDELAQALRSTDFTRFDSEAIVAHAARFGPERFEREIRAAVAAACGEAARPAAPR